MENLLFYFFSFLAIGSSLGVILNPRPTRALLLLVVTMVALSALYLLLGAFFLSIAQIIVYAGAVLVLFLFVIMLQGIEAEELPLLTRFHPVILVLMLLCSAVLGFFLLRVFTGFTAGAMKGVDGSLQAVGRSLFTDFLLPFELTAILLLLGVFAAIALAKKEDA